MNFLTDPNFYVIFVVFLVFIFFAKKALSALAGLIWIAIIGGLFPLVMNYFFKWPAVTTLETIVFYAGLGVAVYLIYLLANFIYALLSITEKVVGKATAPAKNILSKKKKEKE